jgi:NAD(P)-dependent dehydrogenase (short-subunit alcohol dehydrogenase family)
VRDTPGRPLAGARVLITGGNAGVGLETARGLARLGAQVAITSRDPAKGEAAAARIRAAVPDADLEVVNLDLADFASIRACAAEVSARFDRLDVLINNAGLVQAQRTVTAEGFETTFGVNHVGHFVLTSLLLDQLRASAPARVVVVSSHAHRGASGLDFEDLNAEHSYGPLSAYNRSKLANLLFTRELARRLDGRGVTANALHPGFVASRLGRDGDGGVAGAVVMVAARPFAISPRRGARTSIYLASSPEVATTTGGYFSRCRPVRASAAATDDDAAQRLWAVTEELVASVPDPA